MAMYEPVNANRSDDSDNSGEERPNDLDGSFLSEIQKDAPEEEVGWRMVFSVTTAGVITAATVSMAIEANSQPDSKLWFWWNSCVLAYFVLELIIRFWADGLRSFFSIQNPDIGWNCFDAAIVFACIIDQWVLPVVALFRPHQHEFLQGGQWQILQIFRMFRILRLARILKNFKACAQLTNIVNGLMDAIGTVFWIGILMIVFMLIFAIALTDMVGNPAKKAETETDMFYKNKDDIEEYFGSVAKSMFTFFQILTLDNWTDVLDLVYDELPITWFIFALYIFLMGFAMLSLLTGVVAQRMGEVSSDTKDTLNKAIDKELSTFLYGEMTGLVKSRTKSRTNDAITPSSDMGLTLEELRTFLQQPEVKDKLQDLDALLQDHEIEEFFECVDRDCNGQITPDELKNGFLRMRGEMQPKDLLRIRYAAERVARRLQGGDGEASTSRKLEEVNNDLEEVEEKLGKMQKHLEGFAEYMQNKGSVVQCLTQGRFRRRLFSSD